MAFFMGSVHSSQLRMQTSLRVIIPQENYENRKILYLLHGLSGDSSAWTRKTRIEVYAEKHNYTVIMPEVHRSFYTDITNGSNYFSYVAEELPELCEKLFGIRHEREKTFIAGLSMGGYGAVKCGLSKPERYAACASFSGALDVREMLLVPEVDEKYPEVNLIYGNERKVANNDDLFYLAEKTNKQPPKNKPRVFVTCGTSDELYPLNMSFKSLMESLSYDFKYMEWEGGHTWDFWDASIQLALDYFDSPPIL